MLTWASHLPSNTFGVAGLPNVAGIIYVGVVFLSAVPGKIRFVGFNASVDLKFGAAWKEKKRGFDV